MEKIVARWKLEAGLPPVPGQKVFTDTTPQEAKQVEVPLHWRKEEYRILPDSELGPTVVGDTSFRGTFVVYDWDTKEIIWRENWGEMVNMSAGYCFADDMTYLNDLEGASVFVVDMKDQPGRLLRRMSHPYLNDLHSLERTRRGLLATA